MIKMLLKEQTTRINMQCGFRRGYSTIDNLFIIHSLFEILEFKKIFFFYVFQYCVSGCSLV